MKKRTGENAENGTGEHKKTSFTCTKTLFQAATRRARKNRRSMSGHIQHLIEEDIRRAKQEEPANA